MKTLSVLPRSYERRAFSVVELMVVIGIIGLVAALLLPAIQRGRESARNAACKNNLRQIFTAIEIYSQTRPDGRLCSGAFDHFRDGCMDTYSWVADVKSVALGPESLLCPSSPLRGVQSLNDAYGYGTHDNADRLIADERKRYTDGICGASSWGDYTGPGSLSDGYARTKVRTPARAKMVARYFIEEGLNTNYAPSWFFVRTGPRVQYDTGTDTIRTAGMAAQQGLKGLRGTLGPLTRRELETSLRSSSTVPLLADAGPGDIDEGMAKADFRYEKGDFTTGERAGENLIGEGELLAENAGQGPAFYQSSTKLIKRIGSNTSILDKQLECELSGECPTDPTGGTGNLTYLQATFQWVVLHSNGSLNMLMADGSIQEHSDLNGDSYLNPGFVVPDNLTEAQYLRVGYRDAKVDLPPFRVFSGVFISPHNVKGNLD